MNPQTQPPEKVVVVGGGIVGVCCALYLQRDGYQVTLIDPAAPGDSTAKWSCGQMAISSVIPLSRPGILKKVPGWLFDQKGPLALRPSALPGGSCAFSPARVRRRSSRSPRRWPA